MKRTLIALFVALVLVPPAGATEWIKSVSGAQAAAKARNQMIFVDLFAQWCGWCHKFEADVVPTEAFKKATKDMVLLRVDTEDRGEGTKLAQRFQIATLPTFLILNHDLSMAGEIRGYAPAPQFARKIDEALLRNKNFQDVVKQESSFKNNYPKRLEIAREFAMRQAYSESEPRLKKLATEKGVPLAFRDEAFFELSQQYAARGMFTESFKVLDDFAKVQKEGEFFERALILRGNILLQQRKISEALEVFKEFKDRFPNSPYISNVNSVLPALEQQQKTQ